jgi:hypothetical protein
MGTAVSPARAKPTFTFRTGTRVKGVDPEAAGKELAKIGKRTALTPAAVVEAAEPESSPIHNAFEWDDEKAAHEHRLQQARGLIRAVCVVYEPNEEPRPVYVHVTTEESATYEPLRAVVQRPDLYKIALGELQEKLNSLSRSVSEVMAAARDAGKSVGLLASAAEHLEAATEFVAAIE